MRHDILGPPLHKEPFKLKPVYFYPMLSKPSILNVGSTNAWARVLDCIQRRCTMLLLYSCSVSSCLTPSLP